MIIFCKGMTSFIQQTINLIVYKFQFLATDFQSMRRNALLVIKILSLAFILGVQHAGAFNSAKNASLSGLMKNWTLQSNTAKIINWKLSFKANKIHLKNTNAFHAKYKSSTAVICAKIAIISSFAKVAIKKEMNSRVYTRMPTKNTTI